MSKRVQKSFKVSPDGQRVGSITVAVKKYRLQLSVLPKTWRPEKARHFNVVWEPEVLNISLVLHEMDSCTISYKEGSDQEQAINQVLLIGNQEFGKPAQVKNSDGLPLLKILPDMINKSDLTEYVISQQYQTEPLQQLLKVAQRGRVRIEDAVDEAKSKDLPLMLPILCNQFVEEMESHFQSIKRGYNLIQESSFFIRGKILPNSIPSFSYTSPPKLKCEFDDFSLNTPLIKVLKAALRVISSNGDASGYSGIKYIGHHSKLKERSVYLFRQLSDTSLIKPIEAGRLATTIRLPANQRHWKRALELASAILTGVEEASHESHKKSKSVSLQLDPAALWQRTLLQALNLVKGCQIVNVYDGEKLGEEKQPSPWTGFSFKDSYPDIIVTVRNRAGKEVNWCLDAKYKLPNGGPDRADQYQIFSYSHLVRIGNAHIERCALVYPIDPLNLENENGTSKRHMRNGTMADSWHPPLINEISLYQLKFEYPKYNDIQSNKAWRSYLQDLAVKLSDNLIKFS
ncbi:MAG: hypothetical protein HOO85_09150 [Methylotenera sp.]|nr:hypothetical protein [Methylotenera sp.]